MGVKAVGVASDGNRSTPPLTHRKDESSSYSGMSADVDGIWSSTNYIKTQSFRGNIPSDHNDNQSPMPVCVSLTLFPRAKMVNLTTSSLEAAPQAVSSPVVSQGICLR